MDKRGESDFSPGPTKATTSLLAPPSTSGRKKKRGFAARFRKSKPTSSSNSTSASTSTSPSPASMSTSTSPLPLASMSSSTTPTPTPSPVLTVPTPQSTSTRTPSTSPPLAVQEESSGSSDEDRRGGGGLCGPDFRLRRKVSINTNKDKSKTQTSLKEGYLMKQTSSFHHRWHERYFKIQGKKLLYAKDEKSQIFEEVDLSEVTIAESSCKSVKNSFQVITPHRTLHLGTEKRSDMIDWANNIRAASDLAMHPIDLENLYALYGSHNWAVVSVSPPAHCNVCREQLCVTTTALVCEVCKLKSHKRCALLATGDCKWTSLSTMGKAGAVTEKDGEISMPHQWIEGNLPLSSKCVICSKGCGSVLRLQDWMCLWCDATVHTGCKARVPPSCHPRLLSTVPPWALTQLGPDSAWDPPPPLRGCSPLLVFVNSKSGNNQGLVLLNRFKQLLNPAQVFDLVTDGPTLGLTLFKHFEPFRILVCGGDGSVGWVMAEVDRLNLHKQCQIGILPLGTGNDLARVLGWGASFADDAHLFHVLLKYERATTKMLDRWSVMTFERGDSHSRAAAQYQNHLKELERLESLEEKFMVECELGVVTSLTSIRAIVADPAMSTATGATPTGKISPITPPPPATQNREIGAVDSGKQLCEAVKKLIANIYSTFSTANSQKEDQIDPEIEANCARMQEKLNLLLETLEHFESTPQPPPLNNGVGGGNLTLTSVDLDDLSDKATTSRGAILQRANSLEKALSRVMESRRNAQPKRHDNPSPLAANGTLGQGKGHDLKGQHQGHHPTNGWTSADIDPTTNIPGGCNNRSAKRAFSYKNAITQSSSSREEEFEGEEDFYGEDSETSDELPEVHLKHLALPLARNPTIEIESPSSSSSPNKTRNDYDPNDPELSETDLELDISLGMEQELLLGEHDHDGGIGTGSNSNMTLDDSPSPDATKCGAGRSRSLVVPPGTLLPLCRGISPRASRRVSTGSLLKPLESGECSPVGGCSSSSSAASAPPSPHKKGHRGRGKGFPVGKKKKLPIVNPHLSEPGWTDASSGGAGLGSGGFIGRALIQNVDTICAVASPLMDVEEIQGAGFKERCVMNNYFGIGIDAKITLAFHLKREEHPELCGSRIRNFVWYGILGGREFLLKSCRNLEQRIILECDGQRIFLPSLQGIVILNIQSFMGGTNFWGGLEADDTSGFLAPSFDDRVLEVVAVYDVMQMAASRLVHLQHHRIAQCQSVKITILGDGPLPVQVDGEAWVQAPGAIQIVHKNRVQMLCRNRELEFSLKAWDKLCEQQQQGHGHGNAVEKKSKGQKKRNNNRRLKSSRRSEVEVEDDGESGEPSSGPSSPPSSSGGGGDDLARASVTSAHRKEVEMQVGKGVVALRASAVE